jgi:hypothetical protein
VASSYSIEAWSAFNFSPERCHFRGAALFVGNTARITLFGKKPSN